MKNEHDDYFRSLGATDVYDELYPREGISRHPELGPIFARYYFNIQGTEIGYVIPSVGNQPNVHPIPRIWRMPHRLEPL